MAAVGCHKPEPIITRTEERPAVAESPAEPVDVPKPGDDKSRLLGAIAPAGKDESFVVKLLGPKDEVSKHAQAFVGFVRSLKPTGDPAAPLGWGEPPADCASPPRFGSASPPSRSDRPTTRSR